MELTEEDLNNLIEAVGVWEYKDMSDAAIGSMVGMMLARNKEEAGRYTKEFLEKGNNARKEKFEIAICLKAKLILMKIEEDTHVEKE